jgi:phosphatidylinositol alpha-1,6-mannosyltransferase
LVTPDFPPEAGGIQGLLGNLVRNAPGLEFRILTLGQHGDADFDRDAGISVARVSAADIDRRIAVLALNVRSVTEALRFRPDVILSGHVVASLGLIRLKRVLRAPLVQYLHADELRVRRGLSSDAIRAADLIVAVSQHTREMALRLGGDPDRVRVIHPGVEIPVRFAGSRQGPPVLLTVASLLFRYKGHDVMVRALPLIRARVPGVRWIVIGDGPFRPAIENAAKAYGLGDAVELLGGVEDEVRDGWFDRASAFCMPSRLPAAGMGGEGFGIVYLEAAARGLPSIGGDVAGARDAIVDGDTGLLVNPEDHLAVSAAATELLVNRDRAREMGAAARRWAEEHSWPRIASQVEAALREALSMRAGG